jgi:glutaconyl-CoA/methylmalonyl-CoA decarboxylase subunit delta
MRTLAITFDPSLLETRVILMTILGYCVVLAALSLMAYVVSRFHRIKDFLAARKHQKSGPATESAPVKTVMTGEENAAIAGALFLYFSEMHDHEKYVMTIKKVSRTYSPWSSKIYNVLNNIKHW